MMSDILAWTSWLGLTDIAELDSWKLTWSASWAQEAPGLVALACLAAAGLAAFFYLYGQSHVPRRTRLILTVVRGVVLALLVAILADPSLHLTLVRRPAPALWIGLDSSDSMHIADDPGTPVDLTPVPTTGSSLDATTRRTRADLVREFFTREQGTWLTSLREKFDVQIFSFSGHPGIELLTSTDDSAPADELSRWTPGGPVTAIGDSLLELSERPLRGALSGVLLISDFDQNSGSDAVEAARQLGVPVFAVGVGPETAVDVEVQLLAAPTMKQAESSTVSVTIRQRQPAGAGVNVRVWAESNGGKDISRVPVGERRLTLETAVTMLEFPFTPSQAGRLTFFAEVDALPGETTTQNNLARREVRVIDDFLRLLYIEYEPTWEWRFVKEVFHRDQLVGQRGFRTFLRSADPIVRETNDLFVSNLTLPREQFFEADVIFVGDLPASAMSTRFGEMTREFVDQFGGGLVVIAGPRFGPGELADTPLGELLPVVVDPSARRRDQRGFLPQVTALASQFDFMRLSGTGAAGLDPWSNLGKLTWYQPVQRVDPRATVLMEHPTDLCSDGKTRQPLLAIRPYGRGEVVYVGFNELWRLRRLHGETYYRQFWGQLIHRLGLSHALGDQKRFVVRTDRREYRSGDELILTVEAYDADFQPLSDQDVEDRVLHGEWIRPLADLDGERSQPLSMAALKPGLFEIRRRITMEGEHRLKVRDPITGDDVEVAVQVADVSLERRNPVRNLALQTSLSRATGGKAYDLTTLDNFINEFNPPRIRETSIEVLPLWDNGLVLALIVGLLLAEWWCRKGVHLP